MSREDTGGIKYYTPFSIAGLAVGVNIFSQGPAAVEGELSNRVLLYARVLCVTSNNSGSRLITIQVRDKDDAVIFTTYAASSQPKSRSVEYLLFSGATRDSSGAVPDALDDVIEMALPTNFIVQAGHRIRIFDINSVDPLDTLDISGLVAVLIR